MWDEGVLKIPNPNNPEALISCLYWVKHYDNPSQLYGIDGGRISKLTIEIDGIKTCNYDRDWDILIEDEVTQQAFQILMERYN